MPCASPASVRSPLRAAWPQTSRPTAGLGVVLNTSYNIHGEPLVCTPDEAIDVYVRTGADALAIGSYLAVRQDPTLTDSGVSSS